MLNKTQVKVILILLDDKGHAGWELAEYLGMEDSNLHPVLKSLTNYGIIKKGESRLSKREHKKKGGFMEIPYYLKSNLETLKNIIKELIETNLKETWFIFKIIGGSNYLSAMRMEFPEEIDIIIDNELRSSPIFSDSLP